MDAKITKERLGHLFSYDWIKMILASVAGILVWALLFTVTATKPFNSQKFTVCNYAGNLTFSQSFLDKYEQMKDKGVFSYEVVDLNICDMALDDQYGNTLLETRLMTGEGNVIFVNDNPNPNAMYEENGEVKYKTYLDSFVLGWDVFIDDLNPESETGYFKRLEKYLGQFYTQGYDQPNSLSKEKVEEAFRARVKKNNDKRFKTEKQIKAGIDDEVARLDKYRAALVKFYDYVKDGYVTIEKIVCSSAYDKENVVEKYAINLCPNEDTMGGLNRTICYKKTYVDETDGKTKEKYTAENLRMFFFSMVRQDEGFEYESLLYAVELIDTHHKAPKA